MQLEEVLRAWAQALVDEADVSYSSGHESAAVRGQEYAMRASGRMLLRLLDKAIEAPSSPSESITHNRDATPSLNAQGSPRPITEPSVITISDIRNRIGQAVGGGAFSAELGFWLLFGRMPEVKGDKLRRELE